MNKKVYIVFLLIVAMLVASTVNVSAYDSTLTITDRTNDVERTDEEEIVTSNITYPYIDFESLSLVQDDERVDFTMKLVQGGEFQEDIDTDYVIIILTALAPDGYIIYYSGKLLLEGTSSIPILIGYGEEEISVDEYSSGKGNNTVEFSFDLIDDNDRIITAMVMNFRQVAVTVDAYKYYEDIYPENLEDILDLTDDMSEYLDFEVDAGGTYEVKSGQSVKLSGTAEIDEGYNWFWTFDDSGTILEGQNSSKQFNKPGNYTGTLYVCDDKGNWSADSFQVVVTPTGSGGGNNNNEPGFELILVVAAIAIALILLRKKKK